QVVCIAMNENTSGRVALFLLIQKISRLQLVNSLCLGKETLYLVRPGKWKHHKARTLFFQYRLIEQTQKRHQRLTLNMQAQTTVHLNHETCQ
ncbi:hypothetical protein ACXM5X_33810, partial [Pseudomonas saponiphila]